MKEISIAICTLTNLEFFILNNDFKRLIEKFVVIIVSPNIYSVKEMLKMQNIDIKNIYFKEDKGNGLAQARNIALNACKTKYILYMGDDNIINRIEDIVFLRQFINDKHWVGCSMLTTVYLPKTYFQKCLEIRWKYRFKAGEKHVIGTPWLYYTDILKEMGGFIESCGYSDDTDLADRLAEKNYKQGFSFINCCEKRLTNKELQNRFIMYGKGDYQYYVHKKNDWTLLRKIKSILHPVICEFIPNIYYCIFYIYIVYYRYKGWLKARNDKD